MVAEMNIASLVHQEVIRHLAQFGCVKHADPMVQHMLKNSQDPLLRFTRDWMRREALRQHLEAERNQKKINDQRRSNPDAKLSDMRRSAVIDPHLSAEMLHYGKTQWQDKGFMRSVKAEAPAIFPKRQ